MNTIDEAMIAILEKRLELSKLNYSDDTYDDVEEMLHDLEDDFNEKYGDQLEDILEKVHLKHCPESDVLLPTAYLAKKFVETADGRSCGQCPLGVATRSHPRSINDDQGH
jgi:hypothetical protein